MGEKKLYHVVSFSGGKDSTAMLLKMVEKGMQIDCILFCDTGLEFPEMYGHIAKVERDVGMPVTVVKADVTFEYLMLEGVKKRKADSKIVQKYGTDIRGYGWPGPKLRWCTKMLKDIPTAPGELDTVRGSAAMHLDCIFDCSIEVPPESYDIWIGLPPGVYQRLELIFGQFHF